MKRITIILVVAISLFAMLTVSCGSGSPSGTLRSFFKAVEDDDYSKAKSYLTGSALAEFTPSMFSQGVAMVEEEGGIKRINIINENIEGDYAEVDFEIEYKSGYTDFGTAPLVKVDGKWKFPEF